MTLAVTDLSYDYGRQPVLKQVTLKLSAGFNVLLGPNGAGKSTLFSLLTGLYVSKQGEIAYGDLALSEHPRAVRALLGVVFQQSTLDLDLTVKQNLLYHACLHGLSASQALANIEDILSDLKLSQRLHDRVRTLNGGHRRRLEIARALMHQPKYLLLDEPTVGLDNESRQLIISHIRKLAQARGICVVWTTHLMDEVSDEDNLIVLNRGEVKAQSNCAELCRTHKADQVYQLYHMLTDSAEIL